MSRKLAKKTVELTPEPRPSRIRREPARAAKPEEKAKELQWLASDREIKLAVIGIVLFALALNIVIVAVSAYTN